MKCFTALLATATVASALSVSVLPIESSGQNVINFDGAGGNDPTKCLIETAEGETRWVNEDEKWEMRRVG